jgi:adenine-specific DNA-methyltransferase
VLDNIKELGQIFTPDNIVKLILDEVGYIDNIHNKKIMEPSCGNGNFLIEIINRFITDAQNNNLSKSEIINLLLENVWAIEIDENLRKEAVNRINNYVKEVLGIKFDFSNNIKLGNTLILYKDFISTFDYIVGNPPYVRIQNLSKKDKNIIKQNFNFSTGNTDLYIIFFEIAFNMIKSDGKIGFITPNSYFKNSSNSKLRKFLLNERVIKKIIDFGHKKIFGNISTYTSIIILNFGNKSDYFEYECNGEKKCVYYDNLQSDMFVFENDFNINNSEKKLGDYFIIQNGLATLRDKIFIKNSIDEFGEIENDVLKPIIKASKMENKVLLLPYKIIDNKIIKFVNDDEFKDCYPKAYSYLLKQKEELKKRNLEKNTKWFEFGRSQGLKYILNEKIVISPILFDKIKYKFADDKTFVYSGLFAIKKHNQISFDMLEEVLNSKRFIDFAKKYGKIMSGGYINISSKILKEYRW